MNPASMLNPIRSPRLILVGLMLAAIAILVSGSSVFAAGYSVELGVDSRVGTDAGTLKCDFGKTCSIRLEPFGLKVDVYVSSRERGRASVSMYGNEPGCCYFEGAAPSFDVDLGGKPSRLPIFRGQRARGALFIENERVGTLYLSFQRP